jgi:hypothetical protein
MEITKQKFKRIKNKVLKKYPTAVTKMDRNGLYYVSDGTKRLCEEYMIPSQKTVAAAWHWVAETTRIDQNIQRTHPNRMDIGSFEKKFNRISNRNKGRK